MALAETCGWRGRQISAFVSSRLASPCRITGIRLTGCAGDIAGFAVGMSLASNLGLLGGLDGQMQGSRSVAVRNRKLRLPSAVPDTNRCVDACLLVLPVASGPGCQDFNR
jgi:hypothetical protein